MSRPQWDDIWLNLALTLAKRSDCKNPDRKVGCVIVTKDNSSVVAIGYNGGPAGFDDYCRFNSQYGDVKYVGSRCDCVHAEQNAIAKLDSRNNNDLVLYVTLQPCALCASLIINCKCISEVVYCEDYSDLTPIFTLEKSGIIVRKLSL